MAGGDAGGHYSRNGNPRPCIRRAGQRYPRSRNIQSPPEREDVWRRRAARESEPWRERELQPAGAGAARAERGKRTRKRRQDRGAPPNPTKERGRAEAEKRGPPHVSRETQGKHTSRS